MKAAVLELLFNWWNFGQLSAIVKYDSSSIPGMVYFAEDVLNQFMLCEKNEMEVRGSKSC